MDSPDNIAATLARIDERTTLMRGELSSIKSTLETTYVRRSEMLSIEEELDDKVSQSEFRPVRALVFGIAGAVLLGFMYGLVQIVIGNSP